MKKFFAIAMTALTLFAVSCKKDEPGGGIDKTTLTTLITQCKAVLGTATTATYPQAAISAFSATINDVETAAASVTTQAQVNSLVTRLQAALTTFQESAYDAIKNDDIIFALSFNEGTGTELKTTGKNVWTAKLQKGAEELFPETKLPEFVDGKVGKALHFNDASHLSIADFDPKAVTGMGAMSISCWVKPDQLRASNYIVSLDSWHVWKFQTQDGGKPFYTLATNKGITDMDNERDGSVEVGKWSHLVISWSNVTGDINMYVNGELTKTWTGTDHEGKHGKGSVVSDIAEDRLSIVEIAIGSDETINMKRGAENAQIIAWDAWFCGTIDELAVYNIALSQGQVTKLYNDQK